MSWAATKFCVCVIIFWTLISLDKCGRCSLNEVHKLVDHDACSSHYNGLQNTFASYVDVDAESGHQSGLPVANSELMCTSSELVPLPSALSVFHSEAQCSRMGNLDINGSGAGAASSAQSSGQHGNGSWSSDSLRFRLPDGGMVTCSLDYRELGHEISTSGVNSADDIVLSSCKSHLLYQLSSFSSKNIEIGKHHSLDSSSPRVNISPSRLDWGQNYLYHPSIASLRVKNTCNETVLNVYVPFSTDTQFYPFNFSEVVLGPGEVTSVSFVFLPKWLGSSSAELVVQTSFGGFLVEAKGFAVESPYSLTSLVGSSGGWLSRNLSLWNPFDETIHLEEVTTWVSLFQGSRPFLAEAICRKHNHLDSNKHSFSNTNKVPSVESGQFDSLLMAIMPLSHWAIGPHRTESVLKMSFSPDSEGQVLGAICIQLLRPLSGEKDTLVVPFEAEVNKTTAWEETSGPLSVYMEPVGHCGTNETTIPVFVRNSALHSLKMIKISEVFGSTKLLQVKASGELLLFPGTITLVALVTYESSNVNYHLLLEMVGMNKSCMLQILTNDTMNPTLEVSCQEIFGVCSQNQQELPTPQTDSVDFSNGPTGFLASRKRSSILIKPIGGAEVDEYMLQNWRGQSTMSGLNVLDNHELLFPVVPIGGHYAKSIAVRNPSQQPVLVQLILNSGEITENCKDHHGHLQPPSSNGFVHDDSTIQSRFGFSIVDSTVTEAYLHPNGTGSLGPILFHPSNRCAWKSSALIRNNLSGIEWLSLSGFGGSLSLVLLEDSEQVDRLEFDLNLRSALNMSSPDIASNILDATSGCRIPLSKKLFAVNAGDFPIKVQSIHVSGAECGLDGFVVYNCKSFSLKPGESVELEISYQTDFSASLVQRDLELTLVAGVLVIPMKASLPRHMLNFCRKSIFWARVKKGCVFIILAAIFVSLIIWFLMHQVTPSCPLDYRTEGNNGSIRLVKPRGKSSALPANEGRGEAITAIKQGKPMINAQTTDSSVKGETKDAPPSNSVKKSSFQPSMPFQPDLADGAGKFEVTQPVSLSVRTHKEKRRRQRKRKGGGSGLMSLIEVSSSQSGNSTPSSPLSPVTSSFSPKETCPPSPGKRQPLDSASNPFSCDTGDSCDRCKESELGLRVNALRRDTGDPSHNTGKTGSRPMLLPSATFPGMGRSTVLSSPCPPSRLSVSPNARAPGPKSQKAVQPEERAKREDTFAYDIWGNHFSGLHLMTGVNDQSALVSRASVEGNSDSFFLRGPQQTIFTNCRSKPVK